MRNSINEVEGLLAVGENEEEFFCRESESEEFDWVKRVRRGERFFSTQNGFTTMTVFG